MSTEKRKRRGPKKPKDINAPKKNQSSYFLYSNERRPVIASENKGQSVTDISKTISAEWKAMDADTKKIYEDKAAIEKQKYIDAFAIYSKTDHYEEYQRKLRLWKEENATVLKKGKPPKKPKQPPSMPKRPQTSYFVFANKKRCTLKDQYPDKRLTQLSRLIGDAWKLISSEEKLSCEEVAKKNKERYQVDIAAYKETDEYSGYMKELEAWKARKRAWEDDDENEIKVSLPRKPKDAKCPKRPLTSYFLYAKEVRVATKEEFPTKSITEIAKEISKKWKVLTEDEKVPYNEEALRLKEQYKKDMLEYEGSESQIQFKQRLEEWKTECTRRKQVAKAKAEKQRMKSKQKSPKKKPKRKSPKKSKKKVSAKKRIRKRSTPMKVDTEEESSDSSSSDSDSSSGSSSDSGSDSDSSSSGSSSSGSESSSN